MECLSGMKRAEQAFIAGMRNVKSMSTSTPHYPGLMGKVSLTIPGRRLLL